MHDRERSREYAEALDTLSNPERIYMLTHLMEEDETSLEGLSEHMESEGYENASVSLVHQHLPLLEDYGVVEVDDNTVIYRGDELVEEFIETIEGLE